VLAPYTRRGRPQPCHRDKPASLRRPALPAGPQAGVELIWRQGGRGLQRSRSEPVAEDSFYWSYCEDHL
jgi:hypothetical protein